MQRNEQEPADEVPAQDEQGTPGYSGASGTNPHSVFDRMAVGMGTHATTFDLGRVDLNKRFSEIESVLDEEAVTAAPRQERNQFSRESGLNENDVLNDISIISSLLEQKLEDENTRSPQTDTPGAFAPDVTPAHRVESSEIVTPDLTGSSTPAPANPEASTPEPAVTPPAAHLPSTSIAPSGTERADPATGTHGAANEAAPSGSTEPATGTPASTPQTPPAETTTPSVRVANGDNVESAKSPIEPDSESPDAFGVTYKVPVVGSGPDLSVSAASGVMLVAWRDQNSIVRADLIAGTGSWAPFKEQLRLEGEPLLRAFGLKQNQYEAVTPALLNTELRANGPLWIHPPGDVSRSRIVIGIEGDGAVESKVSFINPAVPADGTETGKPTIQSSPFESLYAALGGEAATITTVDAAE